jgi:hypothetical protein
MALPRQNPKKHHLIIAREDDKNMKACADFRFPMNILQFIWHSCWSVKLFGWKSLPANSRLARRFFVTGKRG